MRSSPKQPAVEMPAAEVALPIQAALLLLLKAYDYARSLRRTCWDFAVEIQGLCAVGLTSSDLRLLVCRGHAEHAAEVSRPGKNRRSFRHTGRLTFTEKTCVVLTEAGAAFARQVLAEPKQGSPRNEEGRSCANSVTTPSLVPRWDGAHRELRVGSQLVKRFKQPAPSQEAVLAALEEEGWPPHIDDPLPPQSGQDTKRRLHETITNLNRNQAQRLIRFLGDGTGRGVQWELLQ